jgi:hypothetical protein
LSNLAAFPQIHLYTRGAVLNNYREVYKNVSLKILYILSKIAHTSLPYFLEGPERFASNSAAATRKDS